MRCGRPRPAITAAVLAILAITVPACSGGNDDTTGVAPSATVDEVTAQPTTTGVPPSLVTGTTTAPAPAEPPPPNPECAPGADRTITELPDAPVDAVVVPDHDLGAQALGGETIPAVHIPGFTIPEHIVDGGCIVQYAAPGGCVGAVEITGVTLPDVVIPGLVIEPVVVEGEEVAPGIEQKAVTLEGATSPTVRREQTCAVETTARTGGVPALFRERLVREAATRPAGERPFIRRHPICVEGSCSVPLGIDQVVVPVLVFNEVWMPDLVVLVNVVAGAPEAAVVETPGQTSYTAPADVLFDFGEATLRPDAIPSLQAIVAAIAVAPPDTSLLVEGHTDDVGDEATNDELSRARAQAVTDWLVTDGGIAADRITTSGLGEHVPVAPNVLEDGSDNPGGRALNRRVVISVVTA